MRNRESYLADYRFLKSEILVRMVEVDALQYQNEAIEAALEVLRERGIEAQPPPPETHDRKIDRAKQLLSSGHSRAMRGLALIGIGILTTLGSGGRWIFYGLIVVGLHWFSSGLSRRGKGERLKAELGHLERRGAAAQNGPPAVASQMPSRVTFNTLVDPESTLTSPNGEGSALNLERPAVDRLQDPDEMVVAAREVLLVIDYPLSTPAERTLTAGSESGFSRRDLVLAVSRAYREVYEEEERTAETKTIPVEQRAGILNRNRTDGRYGIWGHDLGDLVLHSATVSKLPDGRVQLRLAVDS